MFDIDDLVFIASGEGDGEVGTVVGYDRLAEPPTYQVEVTYVDDDGDEHGPEWLVKSEDELSTVEIVDDEQDEDEEAVPPFGMSSDELSSYLAGFIERCSERVTGVGQQQYSEGDYQLFESLPLEKLLDMLQEELQDAAVYAAMLDIRVKRFRNALKGKT